MSSKQLLTHWGQVMHICVSKLTIIGSDNGLSPGRRQAIISTNAGILLTGSLRTNFSEILIGILTFSFTKMHLKISSAKWRPFYLGLNVLTYFLPSHAWWCHITIIKQLVNSWLAMWHKALVHTSADNWGLLKKLNYENPNTCNQI